MGAVCCKHSEVNSKSEQLLDEDNGEKIEVVATNSNDKQDDELILLTDSDDTISDLEQDVNDDGDLEQTEILEKELQKEITKMSARNTLNGVNGQYIDNDINELNESEDDQSSLEMDVNDENGFEKDERRPSNLFRAKSRNSWKSLELDEQESALKEQMMILQKTLSD